MSTTELDGWGFTDDDVADGTQIPRYHPSSAEAEAQAYLETGDAGVPDPDPVDFPDSYPLDEED